MIHWFSDSSFQLVVEIMLFRSVHVITIRIVDPPAVLCIAVLPPNKGNVLWYISVETVIQCVLVAFSFDFCNEKKKITSIIMLDNVM